MTKRNRRLIRLKRIILARHLWFARSLLLALVIVFIGAIFYFGAYFVAKSSWGHYVSLGRHFVFANSDRLKKTNNRTNILLLGKAGGDNIAPDLTDTIIFISLKIDEEDPDVDMVSIPRDFWIADLRAKLNSAYYWGNQKREDGGLVLAKAVVEEIVGVPIHYGAVVDFDGFREFINLVGGVDVAVEQGFVDERFPIPGKEDDDCEGDPEYLCRYETIEFATGEQHMDGDRALKFVRSRQSSDIAEGTDFARATRQQKVLAGIKEKLATKETLFSPRKLVNIYEALLSMTETDLSEIEMSILARFFYNAKDNIASHSIPEELIINPPISTKYDNLYVFIPVGESWEEIHLLVEDIL